MQEKLEKAAKLALEALVNGKRVRNAEGGTKYQPDLEDAAITALHQALAEQPAPVQQDQHEFTLRGILASELKCWHRLTEDEANNLLAFFKRTAPPPAKQDGETIAQTFTGLPKRKLHELLTAGWQVNGVCFQRTEEDGTVRRGAVTTGGMVLWWNQPEQSAQQEPVAWMHPSGGVLQRLDTGLERNTYIIPLYTRPQAREPLPFNRADMEVLDINQRLGFKLGWRSAEEAHGITGEKK